MPLSTKKGSKIPDNIQNAIKKETLASRIVSLTKEQHKALKLKSIINEVEINELVDKSLKDIMRNPIDFMSIDVSAKRTNLSIKASTLKEMKIFLIEHDNLNQEKLIYNAVLNVIA